MSYYLHINFVIIYLTPDSTLFHVFDYKLVNNKSMQRYCIKIILKTANKRINTRKKLYKLKRETRQHMEKYGPCWSCLLFHGNHTPVY